MRSAAHSSGARLALGTAAAAQAVAHGVAAGPLVAAGQPVGSILALFCLAGIWASLRLMLSDCIEGRTVVVTLGALSLLGFALATTIGYPGQPPSAVTLVNGLGAVTSLAACIAMLVPRPVRATGRVDRATYHR